MKRIKSLEVEDIFIFPKERVPVTQVINKLGYSLVRREKADKGYILPPFSDLIQKDWGAEYLHTTDSYFEIVVTTKINGNQYRYIFKFNEEWITDLASVPQGARSMVDDNAPWIIAACQAHDLLFALQGDRKFDFRGTNKLFYKMCLWSIDNYLIPLSGFKKWRYKVKAWKAWLAVNTFVGRKRWNTKREDWEKRGGSITVEQIG